MNDVMTSAADADTIIELLDKERAALLAVVGSIPLERRIERMDPNRWSVVEVLEHVSRVDGGVTRIIANRAQEPLTATPEELRAAHLTEERAAWVRERKTRVQAPERVRPSGTLSMEAVLEQLANTRAALKQAYVTTDPAVLDGAIFPHPFLGPITVRGWVELAAHHDARHALQIAEIAAQA